MNLNTLLEEQRGNILSIAAQRGVRDICVFGSVARGDAGPDSDLDLLVELQPGRGLMDLGHLLMELQELLQCKVDVVTEKGLHWYIRVLQEAVPL